MAADKKISHRLFKFQTRGICSVTEDALASDVLIITIPEVRTLLVMHT